MECDLWKIGDFVRVDKGYEGYKYPDPVSKWFSAALKIKMIILHSDLNRALCLDPKTKMALNGDMKKTFCTDSGFHVINKASVDQLRRKVH